MRLGGGESELNPELSKAHCEKSGAAIDWLDEDIGVDFGSRTLVAGAYAAFDTMRVTLAGDNSGRRAQLPQSPYRSSEQGH